MVEKYLISIQIVIFLVHLVTASSVDSSNSHFCAFEHTCIRGIELIHHIRCPASYSGAICKGFELIRTRLIQVHNILRNKIAGGRFNVRWPKAANMRQLVYDPDLQANAEAMIRWCDKRNATCKSTHHYKDEFVGEVTYKSPAVSYELYDTVNQMFYRMIDRLDYLDSTTQLKNFSGDPTYLDSVLPIWATTHQIGCAAAKYKDRIDFPSLIFVCFYARSGGTPGEPIYEAGKPCSKCPYSSICYGESDYPNLCAGLNAPLHDSSPRGKPEIGLISFIALVIYWAYL